MGDFDSLSDDYVASILAKDAKDSSIKYSALGVGAFLPSKVPPNKPRPNTRFLRNIIQETDSHNATLLAKEAAEAKTRFQNLANKDNRPEADVRRRQLGHIAAHLTGRPAKRRPIRDAETESENPNQEDQSPRTIDKDGQPMRYHGSRRERYHRNYKATDDADEDRALLHHGHKRRRSRSEERSSMNDEFRSNSSRAWSPSTGNYRRKKPKHNADLSSRHSSKTSSHQYREDSERENGKENGRSRRRRRLSLALSENSRKIDRSKKRTPPPAPPNNHQDEDSDPLEDIIGPLPPRTPTIQSRGRGTMSSASGIDLHFSSHYDPATDVMFDPGEENDWDQALEALRDRQKWKQQGADRLRSAGFTEDDIKKWEKSDEKGDGNANNVKWAKKGETKEWDRGKVFSADSEDGLSRDIDLSYGRLKGT